MLRANRCDSDDKAAAPSLRVWLGSVEGRDGSDPRDRGPTQMTKLSDTQAIILSAAAQRPDGNLLPLPGSLRGGERSRPACRFAGQ